MNRNNGPKSVATPVNERRNREVMVVSSNESKQALALRGDNGSLQPTKKLMTQAKSLAKELAAHHPILAESSSDKDEQMAIDLWKDLRIKFNNIRHAEVFLRKKEDDLSAAIGVLLQHFDSMDKHQTPTEADLQRLSELVQELKRISKEVSQVTLDSSASMSSPLNMGVKNLRSPEAQTSKESLEKIREDISQLKRDQVGLIEKKVGLEIDMACNVELRNSLNIDLQAIDGEIKDCERRLTELRDLRFRNETKAGDQEIKNETRNQAFDRKKEIDRRYDKLRRNVQDQAREEKASLQSSKDEIQRALRAIPPPTVTTRTQSFMLWRNQTEIRVDEKSQRDVLQSQLDRVDGMLRDLQSSTSQKLSELNASREADIAKVDSEVKENMDMLATNSFRRLDKLQQCQDGEESELRQLKEKKKTIKEQVDVIRRQEIEGQASKDKLELKLKDLEKAIQNKENAEDVQSRDVVKKNAHVGIAVKRVIGTDDSDNTALVKVEDISKNLSLFCEASTNLEVEVNNAQTRLKKFFEQLEYLVKAMIEDVGDLQKNDVYFLNAEQLGNLICKGGDPDAQRIAELIRSLDIDGRSFRQMPTKTLEQILERLQVEQPSFGLLLYKLQRLQSTNEDVEKEKERRRTAEQHFIKIGKLLDSLRPQEDDVENVETPAN